MRRREEQLLREAYFCHSFLQKLGAALIKKNKCFQDKGTTPGKWGPPKTGRVGGAQLSPLGSQGNDDDENKA